MADGYTEADLNLLAEAEGARRNGVASDGRGWFRVGAEREECFEIARTQLAALAGAGRLLPEGTRTEAQYAVERTHRNGNRWYSSPYYRVEHAARKALEVAFGVTDPVVVVQRAARVGPWVPVPTPTAASDLPTAAELAANESASGMRDVTPVEPCPIRDVHCEHEWIAASLRRQCPGVAGDDGTYEAGLSEEKP